MVPWKYSGVTPSELLPISNSAAEISVVLVTTIWCQSCEMAAALLPSTKTVDEAELNPVKRIALLSISIYSDVA